MDAITKAVEAAGGHVPLAKSLGIHPSLVSQWVTGRLNVAPRHCLPIESLTGGAVTRHDLRPDIFGPAPDKSEARDVA